MLWLLATLILVSVFISEDLACILAGSLAASGTISLPTAILVSAAGILIGDIALFFLGRWLGGFALQRGLARRWISKGRLAQARGWLAQRGSWVIFLSRFVPGMRVPTYFAAGSLRMGFWRFFVFLLAATMVWTPIIVVLSAWLGKEVVGPWLEGNPGGVLILFLVLACLFLMARQLFRLRTHRGRRRWMGRIARLGRFEFWPSWIAYLPVLPYLVFLAVRYRGPTTFTAANPGLTHGGGFVGEPKHLILRPILEKGGPVADFELIPAAWPASRLRRQIDAFVDRHGFPIVLKPDVGERGRDVAVIRQSSDLDTYLECERQDLLAQEYIGGREFGIFYYRYPGQGVGSIFSITEKSFPCVRGDGLRTLEELILADDRAVCLVDTYLSQARQPPEWIVPRNRRVQLVDVGAHCRGTLCLDSSRLMTPSLLEAVEATARMVPGFFLGRFDVKTPSREALGQGRFKVLELNGVSSEATHIYDPEMSVGAVYRSLWSQWRLAFSIGSANRSRGVRPATLGLLISEVARHFGRTWLRPHLPPQPQPISREGVEEGDFEYTRAAGEPN